MKDTAIALALLATLVYYIDVTHRGKGAPTGAQQVSHPALYNSSAPPEGSLRKNRVFHRVALERADGTGGGQSTDWIELISDAQLVLGELQAYPLAKNVSNEMSQELEDLSDTMAAIDAFQRAGGDKVQQFDPRVALALRARLVGHNAELTTQRGVLETAVRAVEHEPFHAPFVRKAKRLFPILADVLMSINVVEDEIDRLGAWDGF